MKINGEWLEIRTIHLWGNINAPSSGRIGFYGVHVEVIEQAEARIAYRIGIDIEMNTKEPDE